MNKKEVIIFTDGSSRGNPGPGGWAAIVIEGAEGKTQNEGTVKEFGGREENTTNNRMEIMAAIGSISNLLRGVDVLVYTDSSYLINGITKWINGWKKNGWKTKTKEDVLNKDLWLRLDESIKGKSIKWQYIGGHSGIVGNERCDHIATDFAGGVDVKLFKGKISDYDLPNILDISFDDEKVAAKKSSGDRSKAKAYSYISCVDGVVEVHHSWADCEKRVKGAKGARYRKSLSREDEERIIAEFSTY